MTKKYRKALIKGLKDDISETLDEISPDCTELQFRMFVVNCLVYTADTLLWNFDRRGEHTSEQGKAIRRVRVKLTDIPIMRDNEFLRNFNEGE